MPPHRRIDVVLDSVKRLQRIGASANLLNLLQKQRPADLADVFKELPDRDCRGALNLLLDHNSRLAMEALIEYGPEPGAVLLADYPADQLAVWLQDLPSDDAVALIDELPDDLSAAVLEQIRPQASGDVENLLEYAEQTAVAHHEPIGLRIVGGSHGRRGDRGAPGLARGGDGLLSLCRRRAPAPGGSRLPASVIAGGDGDTAAADHDDRPD